MAAPTLFAQGVIDATANGGAQPVVPAHQADDVLWATVILWAPNTAGTLAAIGTPTGWNAGPQVKQGEDGWVSWFWTRATAAGTTASFPRPAGADIGTDTCMAGRVDVIRGCIASGDPFDVTVAAGPFTAASKAFAAVTVSGAERMVVQFLGIQDNTGVGGAPTGWTVGTTASTTVGTDANTANYRQDNVSANTAGSIPLTAAPANAGSAYAYCGVSFKPPSPAPPTTPDGYWGMKAA